jgi:arylsulfatase A-like enzyme
MLGRSSPAWLLLLALGLLPGAKPAAATAPSAPLVRRVLLVSMDGLRPDLVRPEHAPTLTALLKRGSYSLTARTTEVAVTLPSHVSMLTGVPPARHGVTWNSRRPGYPACPTLFELARGAGYTTAMAAGKSKFIALERPGSLNWSSVPRRTADDDVVADTAVRWIERHAPQVLFVHLPGVDRAGHRHGWGSRAQLEAIRDADRALGRILEALGSRSLLDSTIVIVSADHGGSGRTHGSDVPISRYIPWIAAGPGIRAGLDLAKDAGREIDTEDTFATLCHVLGIEPSEPVDGRPVTEALEVRAAR